MEQIREKFATQVDAEILKDLRQLAKQEGRQIQALVEEAFISFIEEKQSGKPRSHVMEAHRKSLSQYASVYEKLAK